MSMARLVRDRVQHASTRSFISIGDMPGSRRAAECELSRLALAGDLIRVRKGLYWKGPTTAVGMPRPRPLEVGLAVAGQGAGPAGLTAAAFLGLTSQVPAAETVAVAGRAPAPLRAVRFVSRSIERRIRSLKPVEVAVIEVLRDGPNSVEAAWAEFGETVRRLATEHRIRPSLITEQVHAEHHIAARQRWGELG